MKKVKKNKKNILSPSGNRTPVSRVTGGDTNHYTNEDFDDTLFSSSFMTK